MQILDVTNQALDAIEKGQTKASENLYADNFRLTGPVPMPVDKSMYFDLMTKVTSGIPNWSFNRHDMRVEGQTVVVPVRVTGTQSKLLPSLMPGMLDLPATNRSFQSPPELMHIHFQGEKIVEVHVDPVPGGGIMGVLEKLGVPIPVTGRPDEPMK
jgi:hypothetical protein